MTSRKSRVAVIGAGISGVLAAAHLRRAGINPVVFERSREAGGIWLYDEEVPLEPAYPSANPSEVKYFKADSTLSCDSCDEEIHPLEHAPPGPCYVGLKNNVPTSLMKTKLGPWPDGTEEIVSHATLNAYIQEISVVSGVDPLTLYKTSVVDVSKSGDEWKIQTVTLAEKNDVGSGKRFAKKNWTFDAVVVASGHYHACNIPDIAGLKEMKGLFPTRIMHSKGYRRPNDVRDQNVLLIGAGVSSTDIAKELGPFARSIYQSSRGGQFDLVPELLPPNGHRIGEIKSIRKQDPKGQPSRLLQASDPMPITIALKNSDHISNIHRIILCTGYHISYPFLRQYHDDKANPASASNTVLVTDGTQMHNLHKDTFYIPDPSLAFVGVPYYTATFSLFEFQAIAVAAVLSGRAKLPDRDSMRKEYLEKLQRKGVGRQFHSLRGEGEEVGYASSIVDWVNGHGGYVQGETVVAHSDEWKRIKEAHLEKIRQLRGVKPLHQ